MNKPEELGKLIKEQIKNYQSRIEMSKTGTARSATYSMFTVCGMYGKRTA